MTKIKVLLHKTWIFVAATAIIAGSASTMAFALNNTIPESTSKITPITADLKVNAQTQALKAEGPANYTVVDLSKKGLDDEKKIALKKKLSNTKEITSEQLEEKYNTIIANMIPGEKDISAEQAAAYAAGILKKAYGVDLSGYTAEASFSRNPVPFSDNWGVIFHAPNEVNSTTRFIASVDSVKGTMLDAGFFDLDYTQESNKDIGNTEWKDKAVQEISRIIAENVSITGSKVVSATPEGGVMVVCELSDGSACAVRLTGKNKDAVAFQNFPDGYDGSWDYHQPSENGVG